MDTERFTTYLLGMDTSGEGQPVVSVNDIKLLRAGHLTSNNGVIVNLLVQVAGIASCKLHRTQVVHIHVVEIGIDMLTELEIVVGIHDVAHTLLNVVIVDITISDGHSVHGNDAAGMLTLIAKRMRQTKHGLNVALSLQSLRDSIV